MVRDILVFLKRKVKELRPRQWKTKSSGSTTPIEQSGRNSHSEDPPIYPDAERQTDYWHPPWLPEMAPEDDDDPGEVDLPARRVSIDGGQEGPEEGHSDHNGREFVLPSQDNTDRNLNGTDSLGVENPLSEEIDEEDTGTPTNRGGTSTLMQDCSSTTDVDILSFAFPSVDNPDALALSHAEDLAGLDGSHSTPDEMLGEKRFPVSVNIPGTQDNNKDGSAVLQKSEHSEASYISIKPPGEKDKFGVLGLAAMHKDGDAVPFSGRMDTAGDFSLISDDIVQRLGRMSEMTPASYELTGLGHHEVKPKGIIMLNVFVNGNEKPQRIEFYVVAKEECSFDSLLSEKVIKRLGLLVLPGEAFQPVTIHRRRTSEPG